MLRLKSLLLAVGLTACSSLTEPTAVFVDLRIVTLTTEAEQKAWPTTPTIAGGPKVSIRGRAAFACGNPRTTAMRTGSVIQVSVAAVTTPIACPAIYPLWQPFEATLGGLEPGSYSVSVRVAGHQGAAQFTVGVLGN